MVFPFTFSFAVPGMVNPFRFLASPVPRPLVDEPVRYHKSPSSQHMNAANPIPNPMPSNSAPAPPYHPPRPTRAQLPKINRPRPNLSPSPSPSPAPPVSRKRGWEPDPSPSWSTTSLTLASTSGYLDTPSKYREMAQKSDEQNGYAGVPFDDDDMPPLKRRRGLAGSIVNTAVSAALIGTAVGLTVYRMWRDRGKEGQQMIGNGESDNEDTVDPASQPPPPPYQERSEWQPLAQPPAVRVEHATPKGKRIATYDNYQTHHTLQAPAATPRTPATPRTAAAAKRRREIQAAKRPVAVVPRHRRQKSNVSSHSQPTTSAKPEFDFGLGAKEAEEDDGDDQMDWIGGKLAELIEQGKRALNTEVVVMSESREDEVDDGSGAWDSDDDDNELSTSRPSRPSSRAGSIRGAKRSKPKPIAVPSYHHPQYPTPQQQGTGLGLGIGIGIGDMSGSPPSTASTAVSYASASAGFVSSSVPSSSSVGPVRGMAYSAYDAPAPREDPAAWESPLIRESMERARARLLAKRAGA